jgi:serralysin
MANVLLLQPVNMLNLPTAQTNLTTQNTAGSTAITDTFGTSGRVTDYITVSGSFFFIVSGLLDGTIESAALDFGDADLIPNIFIDGLNFTIGDGYLYNPLDDGNVSQVVADLLAGADKITGSLKADSIDGHSGNDTILAKAGDDHVIGNLGADIMFGGGGADVLYGGAGNDTLSGGAGKDELTGNLDADNFRFINFTDSAAGSQRDVILDFSRFQGDKIDLSHIDANTGAGGNQAFEFIGTAAFTGNASDALKRGELRITDLGDSLIVRGDINGDRIADFSIEVVFGGTLKGSDFIL